MHELCLRLKSCSQGALAPAPPAQSSIKEKFARLDGNISVVGFGYVSCDVTVRNAFQKFQSSIPPPRNTF